MALFILILVIIGIKPRYTGIFHWYTAFSFYASCRIIDGGDHAHSILSLLILPLTLMDNRKWYWSTKTSEGNGNFIFNSIAWSFVMLIRIQVSVVYLHAVATKVEVKEWIDGTAVY